MLEELLGVDKINFTQEKMTWQEAIALTAKPLKEQGYIEERYIENMIKKVDEFGPFIYLGEGIALPHARPEEGVIKMGLALLRCQETINLVDDEEYPVKMFICLAASDNNSHLDVLAELGSLLTNKEKLTALLDAKNAQEILEVFKKPAP